MNSLQEQYNPKTSLSLKPFENLLHDIKIPLTIMYTKMQTLEEKENLSEEVEQTLHSMKRNWFRVMKLLTDMDDLEKIAQGEVHVRYKNTDLIGLVAEITKAATSLAEKKNISLEFYADRDQKVMAVDKEVIERILLNLISNAIKYIRPDGQVKVSVEDYIDKVKISVKDNGNGIEKIKLEKIFDRYVGTHNPMQKQRGSGIGLNIVKELVDLLEGEILVRSGLNGTEISVVLPSFRIEQEYQQHNALDDFYAYNIFEIELSDDYNI